MKYAIVLLNEKKVDTVTQADSLGLAKKLLHKEYINKICEIRNDVSNDYIEENCGIIEITQDIDCLYDLLLHNNLVNKFLRYCSKRNGFVVNNSRATLLSDNVSYTYKIVNVT